VALTAHVRQASAHLCGLVLTPNEVGYLRGKDTLSEAKNCLSIDLKRGTLRTVLKRFTRTLTKRHKSVWTIQTITIETMAKRA
jgi:hypothetical protein